MVTARDTSKKQYCYFCVYKCSNSVIGYRIAGHSNLAVYIPSSLNYGINCVVRYAVSVRHNAVKLHMD